MVMLHTKLATYGLLIACAACLVACGCGGGGVERTVEIKYDLMPDHPDILDTSPEAPLRICVSAVDIKSDVEWNDPTVGYPQVWTYQYSIGMESPQSSSVQIGLVSAAQKERNSQVWETMCRSGISDALAEGAEKAGQYVTMVDRDNMKEIIREKDLMQGGVVETDERLERVKQLGVDLFVFGQVNILTRYNISRKKSFLRSTMQVVPIAGKLVDDSPKRQIQRSITFSGHFRAVDARTGKEWLLHHFSEQKDETKKPVAFIGTDQDVSDLEPEEAVIKRYLEGEVDGFAGHMVPVSCKTNVLVESSSNENCIQGVSVLPLDPQRALDFLRAAIDENPGDHHAYFASGVALEQLGRLEEAHKQYRQAACMTNATLKDEKGRDNDGEDLIYAMAVKRTEIRIDRGGKAMTPPSGDVDLVADEDANKQQSQ